MAERLPRAGGGVRGFGVWTPKPVMNLAKTADLSGTSASVVEAALYGRKVCNLFRGSHLGGN